MKTLLSIQYLRALAALAVVAYHACQWTLTPVAVGAAGVDVFFVISGFVMWTTTWDRPITPAAFAWRRLTRVGPPYWVATLALAGGALALPGVFPHVTPQAGHILASMLFIPHDNPEGAAFPLLAVGWTLSYEMAFYLAFALALGFAREQRMAWLAAVLAPLSCLGLLYFPAYTMLCNPMLLQFLVGAAIGRLWLQRTLPGRRAAMVIAALAVALFVGDHLIHVEPDSLLRPFEWGAPAAMLVLAAVAAEADGGLFASRSLKALGDASYSIYLVHTPVMAMFNKAVGPTDPVLFFTLAVALSVAAGLVCHRLVERPLVALLRGGSRMPAGLTDARPAPKPPGQG